MPRDLVSSSRRDEHSGTHNYNLNMNMTPLQTLRKHVTGKIESGEAVAIVGITGNMVMTDSFIQSLKMSISYEFKTRHTNNRGLYTKLENIRDAIAILRRLKQKTSH
jgi:hypothetical protein